MILNSPVRRAIQLYRVCTGACVQSGDIRFAMLVGTGHAFCNLSITAKLNIIHLVLPPLSEPGRRQLLEQHVLPGGRLPSGPVQRALDQDLALQSLCDGTLGIPGAIMVLAEAVTNHYNNGHELGMYALILQHLHAPGLSFFSYKKIKKNSEKNKKERQERSNSTEGATIFYRPEP